MTDDPVARLKAGPSTVYVVIAQGSASPPHRGSLLDQAGLTIEACFASAEDAYRWSTMGDMEVHEVNITLPGQDPVLMAMTGDPAARLKAGLDADEAASVNVGDEVVITAVVESLGHDNAHVFVRIGHTPVQVPVTAVVSRERKESPICPKKHHRGSWERGAPPLDRYTDGSGWCCPGLAPDGSACGYERGHDR